MIRRTLESYVRRMATQYPVVTLTGPRQSGKTTLCRMAFPDKTYRSLEEPDIRQFANEDPRGFLDELRDGAVLDEIQRAPDLVSYLQSMVDEDDRPGRFILTGSQHLGLAETVSQSLAGRTAWLTLLPFGLEEVQQLSDTPDLLTVLWQGAYPRIHHRNIAATDWHRDYLATYVERDVRQVLNVGDLTTFQTFLGLCAGRSAQLLKLSALGSDCGVSHHTARSWLSVLEAGYLVHRLPPLVANLRKRLIKTPKLHFYDSGLVCYLLGIHSPDQLRHHPLRGAIFESWVVAEILKARLHRGVAGAIQFYRDQKGLEVDVVLERALETVNVEVKAGQTVDTSLFKSLRQLAALLPKPAVSRLVYAGDQAQQRSGVAVVPWHRVAELDWS